MDLPSRDEVAAFWDRYCTPPHIRRHMQQVNRVAVFLGSQLIAAGEHVNLELVDRAALLHDTIRLTESPTLALEHFDPSPTPEQVARWEEQRRMYPPSMPHQRVNEEIFKDAYPEMAEVILQHGLASVGNLRSLEEKVVHLADRYVKFDCIVSIKERLDDIHERYRGRFPTSLARDPRILHALEALEQEIWKKIGKNPRDLPALLEKYESATTHCTATTGTTP